MQDMIKKKFVESFSKSVRWWCYWPIIVVLTGCGGTGAPIGISDLQSPDAALRVKAIQWAGENEVAEAIVPLVDNLEHEDQAVRFFAISALRRITGTDHGYDYKSGVGQRSAAVARWRRAVGPPAEQ